MRFPFFHPEGIRSVKQVFHPEGNRSTTKAMRKQYNFWVYILTNWNKTTLYVGRTSNLVARLKEHYENRGQEKTFAGRYYCYYLVYYEWDKYVLNSIQREKEIKSWSREKKEALIASFNPEWRFLNIEFCEEWPPKVADRFEKQDGTDLFGMKKGDSPHDETNPFGMKK